MTRNGLIDIIRREMLRQKAKGTVSVVPVETPDSFEVVGVIDIHELADALMENFRE